MDGPPLRVAFAGAMPARVGGGGLEEQMSVTAAGLAAHGVSASDVTQGDDPFDVLHCFCTEPNVWHLLRNWSRNRTPLVVTPTIVLSPARARATLALSRVKPGFSTTATMRRDILTQADAVICVTEWEMTFCRRIGVASARLHLVGNGSNAPRPAPEALPDDAPVIMVGGVGPRKRQAEVLAAIGSQFRVQVAGGFVGDDDYRRRFDAALAAGPAQWLGHVSSREQLWSLQRAARAQILVSEAEALSLAVMDALASGTHVILSDIPMHRELHRRFPEHTTVVRTDAELPEAVRNVPTGPRPLPGVPTWEEVAADIAGIYRALA